MLYHLFSWKSELLSRRTYLPLLQRWYMAQLYASLENFSLCPPPLLCLIHPIMSPNSEVICTQFALPHPFPLSRPATLLMAFQLLSMYSFSTMLSTNLFNRHMMDHILSSKEQTNTTQSISTVITTQYPLIVSSPLIWILTTCTPPHKLHP